MESHSLLTIGINVGHLTLRERLPDLGKQSQWLVECFCGAFAVWLGKDLRVVANARGRGRPRTLCPQCHVTAKKKGWMKRYPAEYLAWKNAYYRCTNQRNKRFKDYGGRGISMHPPWLPENQGFPKFLAHIGLRPSSAHSLDRIDNDGNYEPGNVRWATSQQQNRNRRKFA